MGAEQLGSSSMLAIHLETSLAYWRVVMHRQSRGDSEQKFARLLLGSQVVIDGLPGLVRQLELDRPPVFLPDSCAVDRAAVGTSSTLRPQRRNHAACCRLPS
jgi:hypothetical protein